MSEDAQHHNFLPLDQILGQDRAINILLTALSAGRVHHAWIFSGPRGVGKYTTALALAAILLDPDAGPNLAGVFESDPQGPTTDLVRRAAHPDLHIIRKELAAFATEANLRKKKQTNIPLDLLRQHMVGGTTDSGRFYDAVAWQKPSLDHAKVFIIDEAELMFAPAQNAILKTLEEPPPNTYIILVTSSEDRLLPTIRSRAQRAVFSSLDTESMRTWADRTNLDPTSAQLEWIERYAQGSPGRASLAIETGITEWARAIEPLTHRARFDAEAGEAIAKQAEEWAAAWVKAHPGASKEAANHAATHHMLSMLAESQRRALREAASDADREHAVRAVDLIVRAESQARANVNIKFVMENLAASLASG